MGGLLGDEMQIEIDLLKLERGLRTGRVKVTRGGKTFWRKQRIGQKVAGDVFGIYREEAEKEHIDFKEKIIPADRKTKDKSIDELIYKNQNELISLYDGAFGTNINFVKSNITRSKIVIENFQDFITNLSNEGLIGVGRSKVRMWHVLDNVDDIIKGNFNNKNINKGELKTIKDDIKRISYYYGSKEKELIPSDIFKRVDKLGKNLDSVNVEEKYSLYTDPDSTFFGDCFSKSSEYIMNHQEEDLILIHGIAQLIPGEKCSHAWVEFGNIVFDGVDQEFYNKNEYYKKFNVEIEEKYDYNEALELMRNTGESGPWHNTKGMIK